MASEPRTPELSRPVPLTRLDRGPVRMEVTADSEERRRLAERFGLETIDRLVAEVRLRTAGPALYRVDGSLEADVVQACVVTLEPVPAHVAEPFETYFTTDAAYAESADGEIDVAIEDADSPEPVEGDAIDVGEVVAQFLSVSLDPYPRAPGAVLPDEEVAGGSGRPNPFAKLESLRRKGG